jgi:hypothetical protein
MHGASEYARLFKTGQHGRLYFVSGSHARGKTFQIFVLPAGEEAKPNGNNPPLNELCVEVYGVLGGQVGWSENYGWLHSGKWQEDFAAIVDARRVAIEEENQARELHWEEETKKKTVRKLELLASY